MIERILAKLTSGRFILTVLFGGTYCGVILAGIWLTCKGKIGIDVFLGIFSGFSAMAAMIVESYFRKERKSE